MSDPFDVLRTHRDDVAVPDMSTITSRARGIERRQRTVLSAALAGVAAIAVVGVVLVAEPGSRSPDTLAQRETMTTTDEAASDFAAVTEPSPLEAAGAVEAGPPAAAKAAPAQGETSAGRSSSAGTAGSSQGFAMTEQAPELTVEVTVEETTIPRGARFTLKACNASDATVKRSFGDAQRYDFEVKDGKQLIWRWSDDMSFAQVTGEETWKPDECKTWSESWDGMNENGIVPSGNYDAVGILATDPELRSKATPFCLRPC